MKSAFLLLVLVVSSCSQLPTSAPPGDCVSNYRSFDRAISQSTTSIRIDATPTNLPRIEKFQRRLRQGGCVTTPGDVAGILTRSYEGLGPVRGATPSPYHELHLATVTDVFASHDLSQAVRTLGFEVSSIGASGLGRRVYIRNLRSAEAVQSALDLAEAMGLPGAYPGRMRGIFY